MVTSFGVNYKLLGEVYRTESDPHFPADKVKDPFRKINALPERDEADREIKTAARECIAADAACLLEWFDIPVDVEEAIRERNWERRHK